MSGTAVADLERDGGGFRNQQVLLDRDVAALYGVETKALNQAVKRNAERFEKGYVFQLDAREVENWKSQIVTSNLSEREIAGLKMGLRRAPHNRGRRRSS